jgi:NAD(P)-dependent dehydrogenase (short-subunit alcohol dehydrogenase family)
MDYFGELMWCDMMQDMTSTAEAKRAVQETIKELGGVDLILANAVSLVKI